MPQDPLQRLMPPSALPERWQRDHRNLAQRLLAWHASAGRHTLPWKTQDPYGIWISEIMLQQTQVSTGLVRYPRWMARFPTVQALAAASLDDVVHEWEGLGYYARARRLHEAAQIMVRKHGGMPRQRADRLALPGIGPSTASAIGAFAWGEREAICDGNVERVWARWMADERPAQPSVAADQRWMWSVAQHSTPETPSHVRAYTQAIMDLGATVCTPKKPACERCPWAESCRARTEGEQEAWPVKVKKAPRPEETLRWGWWINDQGRVAVERRANEGRWSGLWTPVLCAPDQTLPDPVAHGKHDLSHRRILWSVHVLAHAPASRYNEASAVQWLDEAEWSVKPMPRFLRTWWDGLPDEARKALFRPSPVTA